MMICPDIEAVEGNELEIRDGKVCNLTSGKSFTIEPLPQARQAIIDAGGLIPYTRRLILERLAIGD
jgi:3-isopropylmalate/(R)-2-methylmalate dehydratase small subunit